MSTNSPIAPRFDAVLMPHDGIVSLLGQIHPDRALRTGLAQKLANDPERYPYTPLARPDGKPYLEVRADGGVKRHYIFSDPEEPFQPARMVAVTCAVTLDRGRIVARPERLFRGADADFVMSVTCEGGTPGQALIYSDTSQSRGVFINVAASDDAPPAWADQWKRINAGVLDAAGMATLQHLALNLTGRCGEGSAEHARRPDHTTLQNWKSMALRR